MNKKIKINFDFVILFQVEISQVPHLVVTTGFLLAIRSSAQIYSKFGKMPLHFHSLRFKRFRCWN